MQHLTINGNAKHNIHWALDDDGAFLVVERRVRRALLKNDRI
jgi:hypothetical protein